MKNKTNTIETMSLPEWKRKLLSIWDRRDTAGYYELDELFKEVLKTVQEETREEDYRAMNNLTKDIESHGLKGIVIPYRDMHDYFMKFKEKKI